MRRRFIETVLLVVILTFRTCKALALLQTPSSIQAMMNEVATCMRSARTDGLSCGTIDIPLPVTGGTELDDWPGGIQQKYSTILPLLQVTMKALNFDSSAIQETKFIGTSSAI